MRYQSYLNTAKEIITSYDGSEPLSSFLKKKFAANKKYGSTDRKQIAALCYAYYRLGMGLQHIPAVDRILTGFFLCENSPSEFLQSVKPEWNDLVTLSLPQKADLLHLPLQDIFPFEEELSQGMDHSGFCVSFLRQPDLYLRIRPGKEEFVTRKLREGKIGFEMRGEHTIALPNSTKLENLIVPDRDAVVQDLNSQRVLDYAANYMGQTTNLQPQTSNHKLPLSVWDCCAASGGKSILAYDLFRGHIELTVLDIRETIMHNLMQRFHRAGISLYRSMIADLTDSGFTNPDPFYQLIICDAPCSGSGTWSRTPEQLCFFKKEMIDDHSQRQRKIVSNAVRYLKEGGLFIYITCSVFKQENERVAQYILKEFHLRLLKMELLIGYDKQADTMFTAVFIK